MEIRRMSEADVFDVAAIEAKVFSQPWSGQGFRDALAMNHVIFLVAEEAGSILGYCGMYMALDEGEITNVAVSGGLQKQRLWGTTSNRTNAAG